jgi:predicted ATPase|nr:AAA family ATPase [Trichormus azollae]
MQRISIENFRPVKKLEADVTDVMLLIGARSSGKITISKSIFIFKSIKDEIINYMMIIYIIICRKYRNIEYFPNHYIYN